MPTLYSHYNKTNCILYQEKKDSLPMLLLNTVSILTRVTSTMVFTRVAQRAMCAGWAKAVECIDFVLTGPPTQAGV